MFLSNWLQLVQIGTNAWLQLVQIGTKVTTLGIPLYMFFFHQLLRFDAMKNSQKLRKSKLDGLNTVQYDLLKIEKNNLFVRFYISITKLCLQQL